jgi:neurotransmitter:Na+ symporter, NSS family
MVICTVFSVVPQLVAALATNPDALAAYPQFAEAVRAGEAVSGDLVRRTIFGAGNEGITFIWMPQLFARIPFGQGFMVLFFLALFFAAFTSLMDMVELATRVLSDAGIERPRAVKLVGVLGFILGVPAALSLAVLHNQDWVWGVGLMLSGLFFAVAVIRHGARRFREEQLNHEGSDIRVGRWWDVVITVLVPLQALVLIGWWLWQMWGPGALDPFGVETVGTVLFQWTAILVVLLIANRFLARVRSTEPGARTERMPPSVS